MLNNNNSSSSSNNNSNYNNQNSNNNIKNKVIVFPYCENLALRIFKPSYRILI